jgi:hypothetical protein
MGRHNEARGRAHARSRECNVAGTNCAYQLVPGKPAGYPTVSHLLLDHEHECRVERRLQDLGLHALEVAPGPLLSPDAPDGVPGASVPARVCTAGGRVVTEEQACPSAEQAHAKIYMQTPPTKCLHTYGMHTTAALGHKLAAGKHAHNCRTKARPGFRATELLSV